MGIGFKLVIGASYVAGFCIAGWGVYCVTRSRIAADWPSVQGTVNSCEIKSESGMEHGSTSYRVEVDYSYAVSGTQYHGDRIAFGYSGSSLYADHAKLHDKFFKGQAVTVRYNPSNPADSVLTSGFNWESAFPLVAGLLMVLFTTVVLLAKLLIVRWKENA
jgi:hypothetical protein